MAASSSSRQPKASYCVVGCGMPTRGMGWFHGLQLVEDACGSARLTDVVEPWFLGAGKESEAGQEFEKRVVSEWSEKGVRFSTELRPGEVWAGAEAGAPRVALIAGRTTDNPRLFREALTAGATHVLLEKPGAPTVQELEAMAADAAKAGVPVWMGFIKNLAPYFTKALRASHAHKDSLVTLTSLNDYTEATLAECFERNAEGLLKNMAIHELALAATFFGMTAATIANVAVDETNCDLRTIQGRTDFAKLDFVLTNKDGLRLRIVADRCGGDGCFASVRSPKGDVLFQSALVDQDRAAHVAKRQAQHPDWIGYLLTQEDEYRELKERCAAAALQGQAPEGVASIDVAIEALKLAEYLTPLLQDKLAVPA